jgi:hypothetical protein
MSNSSVRPETDARAAGRAMALRALLVVVYLVLAHGAGVGHDGRLAAFALVDIAILVLLGPLLRWQPWAWGALALSAAGCVALARTRFALTPLLLVPPAIVAFVCYGFARTLAPGRVPLITRMAAAMESLESDPRLLRYTRGLTLAWSVLLGALMVFNLVLAALAVPAGLLATAGWPVPLPISEAQWALAAHIGNYGLIGGFMVVEFQVRQRRFPGRYRSFFDFLRRLAGVGPALWSDLRR